MLSLERHLPSESSIGCLHGLLSPHGRNWGLLTSPSAMGCNRGRRATSGQSADGHRFPVAMYTPDMDGSSHYDGVYNTASRLSIRIDGGRGSGEKPALLERTGFSTAYARLTLAKGLSRFSRSTACAALSASRSTDTSAAPMRFTGAAGPARESAYLNTRGR
jgi:hypothetical protein